MSEKPDTEYVTTIRYDGEQFVLGDYEFDFSMDLSLPGTLIISLSGDQTLTIVHGPGIPIAIVRKPKPERKKIGTIY